MKNETGKWILVFLMIICIGVTLWISVDKKETKDEHIVEENVKMKQSNIESFSANPQRTIVLSNDDLYLKRIGNDTIYIGGRGKLDQEDFISLLEYDGIIQGEVTHLVIGDEITEIGYKTIINLPYLTSLKIGENVTRIENGSVTGNQALKIVYLPERIQRVGPDFLYQCNDVYVVTNGNGKNIKDMINLPDDHIIINIHSMEELAKASSNLLCKVISSTELYENETYGKGSADSLELLPGRLQYGPYTKLEAGSYRVEYEGRGFEKTSMNWEEWISIKCGDEEYKPYDYQIYAGGEKFSYCFDVLSNKTGIEFRIINTGESKMEIKQIKIYYKKSIIPKEIDVWWMENDL